ncbi:MAG: hypothetical protein V9G24_15450 [Rhodoblastus sp.]
MSASNITVTADPDVVRLADRVILPGVGAFADCRSGLAAVEGMTEALTETAVRRARPFLGICVGMQLLAYARARARSRRRSRLDRGRRRADRACRCDPEGSAHGVEHRDGAAVAPAPARISRWEKPACTPISFIPITSGRATRQAVIADVDYGGVL